MQPTKKKDLGKGSQQSAQPTFKKIAQTTKSHQSRLGQNQVTK